MKVIGKQRPEEVRMKSAGLAVGAEPQARAETSPACSRIIQGPAILCGCSGVTGARVTGSEGGAEVAWSRRGQDPLGVGTPRKEMSTPEDL